MMKNADWGIVALIMLDSYRFLFHTLHIDFSTHMLSFTLQRLSISYTQIRYMVTELYIFLAQLLLLELIQTRNRFVSLVFPEWKWWCSGDTPVV